MLVFYPFLKIVLTNIIRPQIIYALYTLIPKAEEFKTIEEARTTIHESFGIKVYKA